MFDTATPADREEALDRWLAPFLERLQRAEQRHWAPLSLPKAWADAPARHRKAGVPKNVGFRTKGEIARRIGDVSGFQIVSSEHSDRIEGPK